MLQRASGPDNCAGINPLGTGDTNVYQWTWLSANCLSFCLPIRLSVSNIIEDVWTNFDGNFKMGRELYNDHCLESGADLVVIFYFLNNLG